MSNQNYELNVVSDHPEFKGRTLKKYNVQGQDYVGAYGQENFSIIFKNNTFGTVQVKLSLDGTDILTGESSDSLTTGQMWVVKPLSSLKLKAWPETTKGGASFVFTSTDNSVAAHTHGNLNSKGIISAVVYTEGYREPINIHSLPWYYRPYPLHYWNYTYNTQPYWHNNTLISPTVYDYSTCSYNSDATLTSNNTTTNTSLINTSLPNTTAAIGAGEYVEQKISNEKGLTQPLHSATIQVRYNWWNELKEELVKYNIGVDGMPVEDNPIMNLGSTPRPNRHPVENKPIEYKRF